MLDRRMRADQAYLVLVSLLVVLLTLLAPAAPGLAANANAELVAAPQAVTPVASLTVPSTTMIGEGFGFTAAFDNTGTGAEVGYGPYVDIFLPIGGVDATSGSGPNDGVSFASAAYLGVAVNSVLLICSPGATLTHPLTGLPVNCPASTPGFDASFTWQFVNLELPFGSFAADQPAADITINANLSNYADLATTLPILARGGFRYGADPLDNTTTDPPIIQASLTSASVTPTLIKLTKTYHGPEDETATGPNFPREYTVAVDLADGQTVTHLDISDYLPGNLQFVQVVSTSPAAACGTLPSTTTPGGNLVCTFASVTGTTGTSDATVRFRFYAPLNDASSNPVIDASTGDDVSCINQAGALGDWTPLDPRDLGGVDNAADGGSGDPPEHILGCKSIAIQKSVANLSDSVNSPGDLLEYTLDFQVSDFFAFQNVLIDDLISDGQHFQSSFAPTLAVNGNGFTLAAAGMAGGNVNVICNYTGGPGPECDGDNGAANNGTTAIAFDISAELVTRGWPDGKLIGGCVPTAGGSDYDCDPFDDGATTARLKFRTVILDAYTDDYPSGDPSVDQGDVLNNDVTITGDVLNNANLIPTGNSEADTSAAALNIAQGSLQKTIYAKNGTVCSPQPCSAVQGTPGDTITYRLQYTHPTSDFEQFSVEDFLPLPVFSATEVASFSNTVCGAPAAGAACLGPADTYHTLTGAVTPVRTTNAANNTVKFTYGNFDDPTNPTSVVDILFTVTIEGDAFADGLYLTNQARSTESTTQTSVRTADAIVQLQIFEPVLGMRKGIIATDKTAATFSPTTVAPTNITVSAPGSACPRLSGGGLPVTSSNLGTTFTSNLSGVDAGDLVTFAIVVENTGRGPNGAFDVRIKDDLPTGYQVPSGGAGLNLCVTDGTGALFSVTDLGGGILSTGIQLDDPGPTNPAAGALDRGKLADGTIVTDGRNIAIITFDLQLASSLTPSQNLVNTATLFNYAGQEGGADFTAEDKTDAAQVSGIAPVLSKLVVASSEAHTVQSRLLADFTATGFDGWTPGSEITGGSNTWATAGNTTTFPQYLRIAGTATERGGGYFTYSAPNYLDLRGYNTIGLLGRALTGNAATPLWIQLTDADGTVFRLNITTSSLTAGLPGFSQVISSASLSAPSSVVTAGATAGLDLAQIVKLELRGDNNTSAMAMDIDSLYALRTLVAPGEIVRFRLMVELPEGTSPDFMVQDSLPSGLRFINDNTARVAFVANGAGITSSAAGSGNAAVPALTGAGLNLSGGSDTVSSFSLAVGSGNGLTIGEGTSFDATVASSATNASSDTYNDGSDPYFRLGNLVNSDNDADAENVVIEFNALVTNDRDNTSPDNGSAQQAGVTLGNAFLTSLSSSTTNTQVGSTTSANDFSRVVIVEPQINNMGKTVTTAPVDAGDPIVYQIKFSNNTAHPAQYAPQVRAATTAAFSATFNPTGGMGGAGRFTGAPTSVDGITLAESDRVLVKNQSSASQNGIYKVVDSLNGIWDRATDFDAAAEMNLGYRAAVVAGTINGGKTFGLNAAAATINSSAVSFSEVTANPAVQVATTASLSGSYSFTPTGGTTGAGRFTWTSGAPTTLDDVTLTPGMRVLVKDQGSTAPAAPLQRGVYVIADANNWDRATDFDTAAEFPSGIQVYVNAGTRSGGRTYAQSATVTTLNTDTISFNVVDRATAFDLILTDALPAGVLFQSVTITTPAVPGGQTFTASGAFSGGSIVVPTVGQNGTITMNLDALAPEANISGTPKDVTLTVTGVLDTTTTARQEIVNTGKLTYTSLPGAAGTASNPTGTDPTTSGSVGASGSQFGERDGSGVTATDNTRVNYGAPIRNNYSVASTIITSLDRPTVSKSFKDGSVTDDDTSLAATTGANLTIGEQATFDILVTLPEGSTPDLVVSDVLPDGLRLDSYAVITLASGSGRLSQDFVGTLTSNPPAVSPALPTTGAGAVSFDFGNSTATADGVAGNNAFVLRVTVTVLNILGNQNGVTRTNSAAVRFDDPAMTDRTVTSSGGDPTITVVEPILALTKQQISVAPTPAQVGSVVTYRVTVAHGVGSAAPAYDVRITDALPAGLTLNLGSVSVTLNGSASGAVNNSADNVLDVSVSAIPNDGSNVVIEYQATVNGSADLTVINTADVLWTTLLGASADERGEGDSNPDGAELLGNGALNDYEVVGSNNLSVPLDMGDLPDSYETTAGNGGARHLPNGLTLGSSIDQETNGQPNAGATGDGGDEDGVSSSSPSANWSTGTGAFLVTVSGGPGCLNVWMDFSNDSGSGVGVAFADGDFTKTGGYDAYSSFSEHIVQNQLLVNGVTDVTFPVPSGLLGAGNTSYYFRFRLSPTDGNGQCAVPVGPTGLVSGGEVEDYQVTFPPLAATLNSFSAEAQGDHIAVNWETVSELDNIGFNLYRSESATGALNLLAFVPSQGPGSSQGFAYSYDDLDVQVGQTYWYWLEDISVSGVATQHGPVSATLLQPTAVTLGEWQAGPPQRALPAAILALAVVLTIALGAVTTRRRRSGATS